MRSAVSLMVAVAGRDTSVVVVEYAVLVGVGRRFYRFS